DDPVVTDHRPAEPPADGLITARNDLPGRILAQVADDRLGGLAMTVPTPGVEQSIARLSWRERTGER
ncbi:hypothetical protein, partial [Saccharothrix sp. ST-888]|uniref:hypothetical protein n=1 Tax=Saccharothrix sp. ST-888 TaxID=1427391 RepID=UPI0005ED3C39